MIASAVPIVASVVGDRYGLLNSMWGLSYIGISGTPRQFSVATVGSGALSLVVVGILFFFFAFLSLRSATRVQGPFQDGAVRQRQRRRPLVQKRLGRQHQVVPQLDSPRHVARPAEDRKGPGHIHNPLG